jgi:hypothetical protein
MDCLRGESLTGSTTVPERGMLAAARPGPVKSWNPTKSQMTEEIKLNFDASFQQILSLDSIFVGSSKYAYFRPAGLGGDRDQTDST